MTAALRTGAWPAAVLSLAMLTAIPAAADDRCHLLELPQLPVLEGCRQVAPGMLQISKAALSRLEFDADGIAAVYASGQHYYLRRDGSQLPVISYDNGPDYFSEGVTRAVVDGRLGYYDIHLQPAFTARFDWGWPFENGVAEVCDGCRLGTPDSDGHTSLIGGERYRIDRNGQRLP